MTAPLNIKPTAALELFWQMADKHERMQAFYKLDAMVDFTNLQFWKTFWSIWTGHESMYRDHEEITSLLESRPGSDPTVGLSAKERMRLSRLPDKVTVYRGCWEGNRHGWSWTLSKQKAIWFTERSAVDRKPIVVRAKVDRSDIIAYLNGRGEEEVVINPTHVTDGIRVTRLSPVPLSVHNSARFYQLAQGGGLFSPEFEVVKARLMVRHHLAHGNGEDAEFLADLTNGEEFCERLGLEKLAFIRSVRDQLTRYRAGDPVMVAELADMPPMASFSI